MGEVFEGADRLAAASTSRLTEMLDLSCPNHINCSSVCSTKASADFSLWFRGNLLVLFGTLMTSSEVKSVWYVDKLNLDPSVQFSAELWPRQKLDLL